MTRSLPGLMPARGFNEFCDSSSRAVAHPVTHEKDWQQGDTVGVAIGIGVGPGFDIDSDCDPDSDADPDGWWSRLCFRSRNYRTPPFVRTTNSPPPGRPITLPSRAMILPRWRTSHGEPWDLIPSKAQ